MSKKEIAVIIASVVLFVILAALVVFERQNPEGGTVNTSEPAWQRRKVSGDKNDSRVF